MREQALGIVGGAGGHALQQRLEISGAPEMALQPPAPLHRHVEPVDQRGEQAEVADLHIERVEAGGAHRLDRQPHGLDVGARAVFEAEQLDARLPELRRAMRLGGLMTEGQAVIAKPRRIGIAALHLPFAGRDGEIGAQAELAARRIGELEGAPADLLARPVEEDVRRLQNGRFVPRVTGGREHAQDRVGLRIERGDEIGTLVGKRRHQRCPLPSP